MKFRDVNPISREDGLKLIESSDPDKICDALVRLTYHDSDGEWVQNLCLRLAKHPSSDVRGAVATCFGHLARIHRRLDLGKVKNALSSMRTDDKLAGRVEDALDDIRMFAEDSG